MKRYVKKGRWFFLLILILGSFPISFWAQEEDACALPPVVFSESFENTNFKDAVSSVDHWGEGYVTLNPKGANFGVINLVSPRWANVVTANDFDNDGLPDLVVTGANATNALAVARNDGSGFGELIWIDGSAGDINGPTVGVGGSPLDASGNCGLVSADWDDDGDFDFLLVVSQDGSPTTFKRIWLYENRLTDTGTLAFDLIDKTSVWDSDLTGIGWTSTMMVSLNYDGDSGPDILVGNSEGQVILIRNRLRDRALDAANKWQFVTLLDTGWAQPGISTLSVADFDRDGDLDIIVGSVAQAELRYYKNDGSDNFLLYTSYGAGYFDGAATVTVSRDFDADGDMDFVIGTDNEFVPGNGGQCYYFQNSGGEFSVLWSYDQRPSVYDFATGDGLDYDGDGVPDFLVTQGDATEEYYLFRNSIAEGYNLEGTAQSTLITPDLDPTAYAITKVEFLNMDQEVIGGVSDGVVVEYYVSNNDGANWELYQRFVGGQIGTASNFPVHSFTHYGSQLKWKALLIAPEEGVTGAAFVTPRINQIDLQYTYIERREYSRTSVATSIVTEAMDRKKLIIGGTFYYPGWQGHLRAYDVTDVTLLNSTYTELRTITRPDATQPSGRELVAAGTSILWDAGELLNARTANSRTIFTALPNNEGTALEKQNFVASNAALFPVLGDADNAGLINFVRGEGRNWKLGDINHSNPTVVGPPDGIPGVMGVGYDVFMENNSDRPKVLYVGTNDGMIHCFNVATGEELWGFIPYNLVPMLKNMWPDDDFGGSRSFLRQVYVDGSPTAADVRIGGNWRTILVCGQGPGKGSILAGGRTGNFYFALDITDPANPQPLWEFTHDFMGETWSTPVIGKVSYEGDEAWMCFMGSGYSNSATETLGNYFYVLDVSDGSLIQDFEVPDVDTSAAFPNIPNALPGSPSIVDIDNEGFEERVYFCDLDGRVWKIDVSSDALLPWVAEPIYTDADHYPIITKPAIFIDPTIAGSPPRLYFGTGGDDRAPMTAVYSFVALMDNGGAEDPLAEVEWFLGEPAANRPADRSTGNFGPGDKVWADPQIDDFIVFFSTLSGSIESVDPCENIAGIGNLYGRFVVTRPGSVVGGTAFRGEGGPAESLTLDIKTRAAVTLGEQERTASGARKREVYIQEYDSTIQKLEHMTGGLLKIRSWRELYKIIK